MSRPVVLFLSLLVLSPILPAGGAGEEHVQPTNLGPAINTKDDENDPFVAAGGLALYYASHAKGHYRLMLARRASPTAKWKAGQPLASVNAKDADVRSPFLWAREGRFFFASNKVPDEKFKDMKNFDLWERVGGREATPLLQVDTVEDELFPWCTPSGKEFYFSRKTKDGWRLFVAKGPYYGGVGEGKMIEELPPGFHHCTLSADGLTMYLQGPLENNRWGLFRSKRKKLGGQWTEPEPLTNLNSPEGKKGDMSPCLVGSVLYFVSDRPGGQGGLDIWAVPLAKLKTKK
jgi:hypothetical protein